METHRCEQDARDDCVSLVRQAKAGDRLAADRLAAWCRGAALAIATMRTARPDDAEDLAQEIVVKVQEHLSDLKDPVAFPAWLRTIAQNECRSWHRRARNWPDSIERLDHVQIPAAQPTPAEIAVAREKHRVLRQALRAVPRANSLAFLLHTVGEYTYREIADLVGVPVTTVHGRIHRTKQRLRKQLRARAAELFADELPRWNPQRGVDDE